MLATRAISSKDRGEVRRHAFRRRAGTLAVVPAVDRDGDESFRSEVTQPPRHAFFRSAGAVQHDDGRLSGCPGLLDQQRRHTLPCFGGERDLFRDKAARLGP